MGQLIFQFPFKKNYLKREFYVSSNNFKAYKLIEEYPNWPDKWVNIYGPSGCGKTHLANILKDKINLNYLEASEVVDDSIFKLDKSDLTIIDNYNQNIEENLLYSLLNQSKQLNSFIIITSLIPLQTMQIKLIDLKSRFLSFMEFGIDLPTDELIKVIISKSFSEKQITLDNRNLEYILTNIDRSYEKIFKFIKDIDIASLSSGKSININLIKNILKDE